MTNMLVTTQQQGLQKEHRLKKQTNPKSSSDSVPLCQLTLTEALSLPIRGAANILQPADDFALSPPFAHCVQSTDSIYRPLKMIQTFIALLTEQSTTEMKYRRNKADIFYLKVLLLMSQLVHIVGSDFHRFSSIFTKAVKIHFTSVTGEMGSLNIKGQIVDGH